MNLVTAGLRMVFLFGAVLLGGVVISPAHSTETRQTETVYAVATTAQFMNHADDRLRGMSTNPFNVKTEALVITTKGKEKGNGPFPGDDILYSFRLYAGPKLGKLLGSAMFTCYYNFVKRATCDSYFDLEGGLLLASGQVVFNGNRFTLSVTGGTDNYLGALGEVSATPAAKNAERLELRLLGSGK
jgi:hypothetical protein